MSFRINYNETRKVKLLKLLYLIPYCIIAFIPSVIYCGIKEMGNPFSGMIEIIKKILEK